MKRISLKIALIKIIGGSALFSLVSVGACLLVNAYIERDRDLDLAAQELALSAPTQGRLLAPGILLAEEFGSVRLHLNEMRRAEGLDSSEVVSAEDAAPLRAKLQCRESDSTWLCTDKVGRATVMVPIRVPDRLLGYLVKSKTVKSAGFWSRISRPLAVLAVGLSLGLLITVLWVGWFIERRVRQPLLALTGTLTPVLEGKSEVAMPAFAVSEIQTIATQVEHLVRRREADRTTTTILETVQMLAHDLKRPFHLLTMGLTLIEEEKTPEGLKRAQALIQSNVGGAMKEVRATLDELMEFGSAQPPTAEGKDPGPILAQAVDAMPEVQGGWIQTEFRLGHTRLASVEERKFRRILGNLLGNAVEAMGAHGTLWIETIDRRKEEGEFIEVCIGNSGSFVAEADRSRIFEPFYTKGKRGGTGLGLAIAAKFVRDHGGTIWCSADKEKGVEFRFTIPALAEPLPKSERTHDSPILLTGLNSNSLRVLVIDNDPLYLAAVEQQLQLQAHGTLQVDVTTATSSDEALLRAAEASADLILCDFDLGERQRDGLTVIRALRRQGVQCPIHLHSGSDLSHRAEEVAASGANSFAQKPVSGDAMLQLIIAASSARLERGTHA